MNKEIIVDELLDVSVTFYGKAVVDGQMLFLKVGYENIRKFDCEGLKNAGMITLTNAFELISSDVKDIQMITRAEYLENTEEE